MWFKDTKIFNFCCGDLLSAEWRAPPLSEGESMEGKEMRKSLNLFPHPYVFP